MLHMFISRIVVKPKEIEQMDPNATVKRLVTALESKDNDEARDAIHDLLAWIRRGGYTLTIDRDTLEFLLGELSDRLK